ncbi:MAG: hypothetical protein J5950_03800 [Clostridia bacterium]|nr:hypothetical protein [Clostridia bacterium]
MKKFISMILAILILFLFAVSYVIAADDGSETASEPVTPSLITIADGVVKNGTIVEGNNVIARAMGDVVKFGFKAVSDPMIHITFDTPADTAEYPILAIKAQRTGSESSSEVFYNEPGKGAVGGMSKIGKWQDTEDWQWLTFDLSGCGVVGYLRFDVFPDGNLDTTGMIAAVGFFKTLEDVEAFAATDEAKALGSNPGSGSIKDELIKEKESIYSLFDDEQAINTGWWFHKYAEGKQISIGFDSPVWFDRLWYFAYASSTPCPYRLSVLDINDNELYSEELTVAGNVEVVTDLGLKFEPGYYTILFESVEVDDDIIDNIHFVLGSGEIREDDPEIELSTVGANTNDNTKPVPALKLLICEPDENRTPKPTATPKTVTEPPVIPTPVPTEKPADDKTAEPQITDPVNNNGSSDQKSDSDKKGLGAGAIAGIIGGAVVLVAAVSLIIVKAAKKKKN